MTVKGVAHCRPSDPSLTPTILSVQPTPMTNRFDMLTAFTADEMAVLYDLVCFHDECPDWMDEKVFDSVQEKVRDAYHETT